MPVVDRLAGVMVCGVDETQYRDLRGRLAWLQHFGRLAGRALAAQQAARERLVEAELEAAGRFVRQGRRIIHEAGNPLGIIRSYLRLLERKLPEGAEVQRELGVLGDEIERVAGIVGRLSEIPRPAAEAGGDVGELLRELLAVYGEALFGARGIRLETALPAGPLPVACTRDGIKQILVNLWKNASEALTAGQRLAHRGDRRRAAQRPVACPARPRGRRTWPAAARDAVAAASGRSGR
jgi:signal transduction histidine kinase